MNKLERLSLAESEKSRRGCVSFLTEYNTIRVGSSFILIEHLVCINKHASLWLTKSFIALVFWEKAEMVWKKNKKLNLFKAIIVLA